MMYSALESHAYNNVLVSPKKYFLHLAIFPHTNVPTYRDLSNPWQREGGAELLNR